MELRLTCISETGIVGCCEVPMPHNSKGALQSTTWVLAKFEFRLFAHRINIWKKKNKKRRQRRCLNALTVQCCALLTWLSWFLRCSTQLRNEFVLKRSFKVFNHIWDLWFGCFKTIPHHIMNMKDDTASSTFARHRVKCKHSPFWEKTQNSVTLYNFIIVRLKQTQTTDLMLKEHLLNEHLLNTGVCSAAVFHFIELNMAMLCWIVW